MKNCQCNLRPKPANACKLFRGLLFLLDCQIGLVRSWLSITRSRRQIQKMTRIHLLWKALI